ncbi:MAG TPA: hypothetical protein VFI31_10100 [Pirellulales bacterium]|nr:hypothetical protein [Pirellulales bacterium]
MARSPVQFAQKKPSSFTENGVPSPDEIRRRAAEIRRSWSPEERRQREVSRSGWSLLPLILGSPRSLAACATGSDRARRGR